MIVLSVVFAVLGLVVAVVGALGAAGKLPGNPVVGLRVPEARKSKENWVLGHKVAGVPWTGAGVALIAAGLVALRGGWAWLVFALLLLGALVLLGMGAAMGAHALAQIDARAQREAEAERAAEGCCSSGTASTAAAEGGESCSTGSAGSTCSSDATSPASAEDCASGTACGSCSLNGSCTGGADVFARLSPSAGTAQGAAGGSAAPRLDLDAARRAVEAQDGK